VTILYDAFGESKELTKDWGFSAFVEHNGKRILFDTGNDAAIFEHNVKALGVDLTKLDFVVISHRHADHATGRQIPQALRDEYLQCLRLAAARVILQRAVPPRHTACAS